VLTLKGRDYDEIIKKEIMAGTVSGREVLQLKRQTLKIL